MNMLYRLFLFFVEMFQRKDSDVFVSLSCHFRLTKCLFMSGLCICLLLARRLFEYTRNTSVTNNVITK